MREERGRRARRCLGWGLACWAASGLALLIRVQVAQPELATPAFCARLAAVRRQQAAHPERPLWLVIGSSRLRLGYLPDGLGPLHDDRGRRITPFNFSLDAMGPVIQNLTLRRLLREGVRPSLVVLEVMPMYLHREGWHYVVSGLLTPDLPAAANYIPLPDLLSNAAWRQRQLYPLAARELLPHRVRRLLPEGPGLQREMALPLGGPVDLRDGVSPADRKRLCDCQRSIFRDHGKAPISAREAQALADSIELCRRRAIKVVLLISPEAEPFRRLYPPGVEQRDTAFVRHLAEQTGASFIDGRCWLAEEDFFDGHHPLRSGAEKLTRRLSEELCRPRETGGAKAVQPPGGALRKCASKG